MIEEERGWVTASEAARAYFERHVRRERQARSRRASGSGAGSARAEALLRAVDQLDVALPRGAELMIGDMPAYADDVLAGIRKLAREMSLRAKA